MSASLAIVLGVAGGLVLAYLLVMRVLYRQSKDADKRVDFTKILPLKDEEEKY